MARRLALAEPGQGRSTRFVHRAGGGKGWTGEREHRTSGTLAFCELYFELVPKRS